MEKQRVFVKIKNFKSLADIEVELKPLTFLFGSNAAGKSSFINAFKFFGNYISRVINPNANWDPFSSYSELAFKIDEYTDLGSYKEMVANNDTSKQIEFEIIVKNCCSNYYQNGVPKSLKSKTPKPRYFDFNVKFVFRDARSDVGLLKSITISDFIENLSYSYWQIKEYNENEPPHYEPTITTLNSEEEHPLNSIFEKIGFTPAFNKNIKDSNLDNYMDYIKKRMPMINSGISYSKKRLLTLFERIFILIPEAVHEIFSNPLHVPSLRSLPEKSYPLFNNRFDLWSYYNLLRLLDEDKKLDMDGKDFLQRINIYLLNSFKFDEIIEIKKETLAGYIVVKNRITETEYNLANTSSGLLQLLPIIGLINREFVYKLFFCEQPELHLHPKLQTKLAEFFTLDEFKDKYKVIETHSEHIITKIQVLIAQGKLNKEDVAVYYFDKKEGKTKIKEMKLSERGLFIDDWPHGFFDEDTKLFSELFSAIHKN